MIVTLLVLAAQAAPVPAPSLAATERRICRSQRSTGSRLDARRVCRTAREWQEESDTARNRVDTIQRGAINTGG